MKVVHLGALSRGESGHRYKFNYGRWGLVSALVTMCLSCICAMGTGWYGSVRGSNSLHLSEFKLSVTSSQMRCCFCEFLLL